MNCACARIKLFLSPWQTGRTFPCPCHHPNLSESCGSRERDHRAKQLAPTCGHRGRVPARAWRPHRAARPGFDQHGGGRSCGIVVGFWAVTLASADRERRSDCRRVRGGRSARMAKRPRSRRVVGFAMLVYLLAGQVVAGAGSAGARVVGGCAFRTGQRMERIRTGGAFAFVLADCHHGANQPRCRCHVRLGRMAWARGW